MSDIENRTCKVGSLSVGVDTGNLFSDILSFFGPSDDVS